ncbi:AraC family transcriptional regulator [Mannheimia haemolytica]|uniref:AraC family transcriptional regulator n=1 Tax=Mannheimia haemolytica TaxID=75985 RepID=UPI0025A13117|nr:AraC family transcriptional regulator [Mannheimia haemolytica]
MDSLTHLFTQFQFRTDLFHLGQLCQIGSFNEENKGYLHFVRQGRFILNQAAERPITIERPAIIFSPTNILHSLHLLDDSGLDIFCINFDFGKGIRNPLTHTLHNIVILELAQYPELGVLADQIFSEVNQKGCGYQAMIHHLCAYFTLKVARQCLEKGYIQTGLLKGLADKQLGKVLLAIHNAPERDWNVEELANVALMSRSRFAAYFKQTMGVSPMDYLTNWRLAVAQHLLQKGIPVALVAEQVGYSHNAALSRVFMRELGLSPTEWLAQNKES